MCIVVTDVTLRKSIFAPDAVYGLAVLDGKLYVLRHRDDNQLYVYETETKDYEALYAITIPGLQKKSYNDLTECDKEQCLFVSDFLAKCIHKVVPNGEQSKVSKFIDVPYEPKGLSITPDGNLLVTCNPDKLVEYNVTHGEKMSEVRLHMDIYYPLHAVKRRDGQYVVSHMDGRLSRVVRVGADGKYRHCFGGEKGNGNNQLNYPCHLALREDKHTYMYVIVADNDNHRLMLLDKSMEFVRMMVENFREPHRIWYDSQAHRLYVGECMGSGRVSVYNVTG